MANKPFIFCPLQIGLLALLLDGSPLQGQEGVPRGSELVANSARNLFNQKALETEFRYRSEAYGRSLIGSGKYSQAGLGAEKLFRLEMNTQLEDRKATLQIVCGKQYLWMRRDLGPQHTSLSRVSLRRLRQAIAEAGEPLSLDPSPTWMGMVSLPKTLSAIGAWFEFEPAQDTTLGDRKVLRLHGKIHQQMRDEFLGAARKKGEGREQIPDAIELTMGTDEALPLFPYRIEYLKATTTENDRSSPFQPMLTLDFFSARVPGEIDLSQFEYFPGDQEVEDRTRLFLERLGFKLKDER